MREVGWPDWSGGEPVEGGLAGGQLGAGQARGEGPQVFEGSRPGS